MHTSVFIATDITITPISFSKTLERLTFKDENSPVNKRVKKIGIYGLWKLSVAGSN